jgi:6-phosphogluconolactonase
MSNITEKFFDSKEQYNQALGEDLAVCLSNGIKNDGRAVLMVSGGSSPAPAYKYLSALDLGWDKIDIAMVDERWVDESHEKSNEAFIKSTLMQDKASSANLVTMKNEAATAIDGQPLCQQAYAELKDIFDVTILGMGPDGHTASLFPHANGLSEALTTTDIVAAIDAIKSDVTGDITERMTLTRAGILKSKVIKLLISGDEKLAVYNEAKNGGDVADMPLRAILQQSDVPVEVYWTK